MTLFLKYAYGFIALCAAIFFCSSEGVADIDADASATKAFDQWIAETKQLKDLPIGENTDIYDIAYAFFEAAFSETPWEKNFSEPTQKGLFRYFASRLADGRTNQTHQDYNYAVWLSGYAQKNKEFPVFGALNKWQHKIITISIGNPVNPPDTKTPVPDIYKPKIKKVYPIISDQIAIISADILEATGIELKVNSENGDEDFSSNFGRIRIQEADVFKGGNYQKENAFNEIKDMNYILQGGIDRIEPLFFGGVSFTSEAMEQLEGYFLPDENNVIQMAVCKISSDMEEAMLRAYITECVARSLGVPDIFKDDKTTIFGEWATKNLYPAALTDFDKKILKILYCKEMKPAFSRYQALQILMASERKCRLKE